MKKILAELDPIPQPTNDGQSLKMYVLSPTESVAPNQAMIGLESGSNRWLIPMSSLIAALRQAGVITAIARNSKTELSAN